MLIISADTVPSRFNFPKLLTICYRFTYSPMFHDRRKVNLLKIHLCEAGTLSLLAQADERSFPTQPHPGCRLNRSPVVTHTMGSMTGPCSILPYRPSGSHRFFPKLTSIVFRSLRLRRRLNRPSLFHYMKLQMLYSLRYC